MGIFLRRIAATLPVMAVVALLVFLLIHLSPGDPAALIAGDLASTDDIARLRTALGLDQPLPVQYGKFLQRAVQGDFGVSTKVLPGEDALDIFLQRFPATIELSFFAMLLAIVLGIPLGYFAARRRASFLDNASVVFSLVGVAIPVFFLAFLLKYVFAIKLGWLPVSGRQDGSLDATRVTGFFVIDGLLTREFDAAWDALKHLLLPAVALSSIPFAVIFRITRASVLDVLDEDRADGAKPANGAGRHTQPVGSTEETQ